MGNILDQAVGKAISAQALEDLISDVDFENLEGDFKHFYPFEAVGMVRAEVRHSNFPG